MRRTSGNGSSTGPSRANRALPRAGCEGTRCWLARLAAVGVLVLVACAPPPTTPAPTATTTPSPTPLPTLTPAPESPVSISTLEGEVSIWLDWLPHEIASLREALREFQSLHPGVEVEVAYFPSADLRSAFEQAAADRRPPVLLFGPAAWGRELFGSGLIQDPREVVLTQTIEGLHPLALRSVELGTALVGLPLELQGVVLYRNTDLAPEPATTLDDLVTTARELRQAPVAGASFDFGFLYSGSQVAACGGSLVDPEGNVVMTEELGVCWLNLLKRLGEAGPTTMNTDDDLELFAAGRTAWLIETTARLDAIRAGLAPEKVEIDPWPLYEPTNGRLTGFVWTENAYFAAGIADENLEAAVALVTFLLTPEIQTLLSDPQGAGHVPVLQDITISDPFYDQILEALQSGVPLPLSAQLETYRGPLATAVRLVVLQGGIPEIALELVLQEIQGGLTPTPTP